MNIIAHRGNFQPEMVIAQANSFTIPENTLEAFEKAFEKAFGIETDVRETRDKDYVLLHDENLAKFCGNTKKISDLTSKEIEKVRYNNTTNYSIPTLELLANLARKEIMKDMSIFIAFQLKPGDNFETGYAIASIIEAYKLTNSIIFDATYEVASKIRKEFPWINLSVSLGEENYAPTIYTPMQVFSQKFYRIYNCVWADEWKTSGSIYNKEMFLNLKKHYSRIDVISPELHFSEGHPISANKIEIQSLWKEILSWNIVDGICTDYPSLLKNIIG